jgi:hypothetical protein
VRKGWIGGQLNGIRIDFGGLDFWRKFQRRGAHVNTPELGSRGEESCFGGILRIRADLRRDFVGGDFNLGFF